MNIAPRKTRCALCGKMFVIVSLPLEPGTTALCPNWLRLPPTA
jgi:hypothetical protein